MKRPVDFTLLSNIAASLGMHASLGRVHCPDVAVMPSVTVAPTTRRGKRAYVLYLHMGARPERDAVSRMVCDLEESLASYGVRFEAMGCEYQGGTRFYLYEIEE